VRSQVGTTVSVEVKLQDGNGVAVTGQTPTVAIRRPSDNFFLDFADNTFKASGWTTKNQALTEITGQPEAAGVYRFLWNSALSVTEAVKLALQFTWVDGANTRLFAEDLDLTEEDLADKILVNKMDYDTATNTLRIYNKAGNSIIKSWVITDKTAAPANLSNLPATLPVNRGVPT
jgi:hypothetical protein